MSYPATQRRAKTLMAICLAATTIQANAQQTPQKFDDHQNMMEQLGVKALRRGPDPNNQSTFDEAISNPFKSSMPDVLTMKDGAKVKRRGQWPKRKAEIMEDFEREVYGRIPANVPGVTWEVTSTTPGRLGGIPIVTKNLKGHVDNSAFPSVKVDIQASFTVPAHTRRSVPMIVEFGGFRPRAVPGGPKPWTQQAIEAGWGFGSINPGSVQADNNALTSGIIGLTNKGQPRRPDDWGALRAWQWGVSRM